LVDIIELIILNINRLFSDEMEDYEMRTFNRLQELRIEKGYESQREFARVISKHMGRKISYGTINKMEHQKGNPSWSVLENLASFLDVSVEYLMGRTNHDFPCENKIKPQILA